MTDLPHHQDTPPYAREREVAEALARQAGEVLLYHKRAGFAVEHKTSADDPVTVADREASELIVAGLRAAFPHDGILSEELADTAERLNRRRVWIIDPIDGTKEYVDGTPDYCVSIGLSVNGEAVLGVVLAPEHGELFSGVLGQGVWKNGEPAGFSERPPGESLLAVSDTEYARELHRYAPGLPRMRPSGSIALKLARIAAGEADATFTMSPRSEWDIAAGMALVAAAGGVSSRRDGSAIVLNAPLPHLRRGFLSGRPEVVAWLRGELLRAEVPEQVHFVEPQDDVWPLLPAPAREAAGRGVNVHLRQIPGWPQERRLVALALVGLATQDSATPGWRLERLEGEPQHRAVLRKDLIRLYGLLEAAEAEAASP